MLAFSFRVLLVLSIICGLLLTHSPRLAYSQNPPLEPLRVGVFLDLSGKYASFGKATLNGVKLAVAEFNASSSQGRRHIELIIEDDRGDPAEAATVVSRLINEKRVNVLIGGVTSSCAMAAAPIAQNAEVPMITPATHPLVTKVGDYIFRTGYVDPLQGQAMAQFAVRTLKAKRLAWLIDSRSDYSQSIATAFEKGLLNEGGQLVVKQFFIEGDKDFKAQLASIKSHKPDAILVTAYYSEAALIATQTRQIGIKVPLLGCDGWDNPLLWNLGSSALNGSYITNLYALDNPAPENKEFVARYKALYQGSDPDASAAMGYDALRVLANAIARIETTDGPALRDSLAVTRDVEGVSGRITMDENRSVPRVLILRLQDRSFRFMETVSPTKKQ